ncbi:MAG: MerR family transcriptional regulator [Thiotrichales bacterium]
MNNKCTDQPCYRIGAVSKLTQIPTDTIRVWERRYGVVAPARMEGGNRLYNEADVKRLQRLRELVDLGQAIGSIAELPDEALEERLEQARSASDQKTTPELKVLVIGETIATQLGTDSSVFTKEEVCSIYSDITAIDKKPSALGANVLIIEYPTLQQSAVSELIQLLRSLGVSHGVVIYQFATRSVLDSLNRSGILTLKAPVKLSELKHTCVKSFTTQPNNFDAFRPTSETTFAYKPRLFTRQQLAKLTAITTTFQCECPNHLADLILSLEAFEVYSLECENRNTEDAALHAYLHDASAAARAIMEEALQKVAEAEGINV